MRTRSRRRRWNNIIILGIVAFMALLNLPTIIKSYLIEQPADAQFPTLLNPSLELQALHSNQWSLENINGSWQLSAQSDIEPKEIAQRWQKLEGTEVDEETYTAIKPRLRNPNSLEVWYVDQEEPQRITVYQMPQYWLLKNWQDRWIAVTVEAEYLLLNSQEEQ